MARSSASPVARGRDPVARTASSSSARQAPATASRRWVAKAGVGSSLRAERRGAFCFVVSCAVVLVTHDTVGLVTIALVWLGHVTVTGAELFQSAGQWGLQAELSDPRRRGEYQGVAQLGYTLGTVWAPAAYTFLAIRHGAVGWVAIAGVVTLAAVVLHPATRSAERYLVRSGVTPDMV